ncbi:MAG TPA: xanthine dehydrogenase family protein molybdopterin-binding subunit [Bacilli bacterium]|nr:xanthine dehydrogenase family protein molybdopterin-binding subunit [Bacilli bacterium]HPS18974.1 xanthine dehydrogenase family protein molybdopterin-binding subunit [Bacilli bacterium]
MKRFFPNSTVKIDNEEKMAGKAIFTDDILCEEALSVSFVRSTISKGKILKIEVPTLPEGYFYVDARDIVKENVVSIIFSDWPVFADKQVNYYGETIGLIIGPSKEVALDLAKKVAITYQEETPVFEMTNSVIHKHFAKGDLAKAKKEADFTYTETFRTGLQEHIYLETQTMLMWLDGDKITVKASMQCPFYVKKAIVRTLGCDPDSVRVIQPAVGGAFGGKEHYPSILAAQLATAIVKVKKPLRFVFDRNDDIAFTTKRHPSETTYTAFVKDNRITGVEASVKLNGGAYIGCSGVVLSRGLIASVDCYTIPNLDVNGNVYLTNIVPTAAFRGFGSPQTIFAFEMFINHVAKALKVDPLKFRLAHLAKKGDITAVNGHFHDEIIMPQLIEKAMQMSDYKRKVKEYDKPNSNRGIGMSWFLHGCGFTGSGESTIINAQVKLVKEEDDTVHLYTSQVDFGQGNRTTLKKIVSDTLKYPENLVFHEAPDTDHTLSTGPTAASRTVIIVGYLCEKAAKHLKEQWVSGKRIEVIEPYVGPSYIRWDEDTMQGDAYPGYAWGVNIVEVSYDPITYQVRVEGIWSTYDVGHAIDERIVAGQSDGGLAQGIGYGMLECMDVKDGRFYQKTISDYAIPTSMDLPFMETALIDNPFAYGASGAKGAGELTFVGVAPAVCLAIEQAIKRKINKIPANPEYIMELVEHGKN